MTKGLGAFQKYFPAAAAGLAVFSVLWAFKPAPVESPFHWKEFSELPILEGGRTKPLDSVARNSLLVLSGRQTLRKDGRIKEPIVWLADVMFSPTSTLSDAVFEIDDPDVLGLINIQQGAERRFSYMQLYPYFTEIERQAARANDIKPDKRSRFESAILALSNKIVLYQRLQNAVQMAGEENVAASLDRYKEKVFPAIQEHATGGPLKNADMVKEYAERSRFLAEMSPLFAIPLGKDANGQTRWLSIGQALAESLRDGAFAPGIEAYARLGDAYRASNAGAFNGALAEYTSTLGREAPNILARAQDEALFNRVEPFYRSIVLYVAVLLLAFGSWLAWPETLNRAAFQVLVVAFVVHTVGLVSRMILQGRPPVTNLYSSAIFVGWMSVLLGIAVERLYKNSIGNVVAGTIGFITLIIAHHLANQGDTLEMMRAVLDSNFWLATHVVTVTIGYSSTFVSGFIATVYLLRQRWDRTWTSERGDALARMTYGVICFSTFFSFLGTILGGIWADQSWGRFWGWDPKENGALMIVLWNSFLLHARWGKLFDQKEIMVMAVFGNVVTALSWFGVNMLGIGLHSYGFMDKAFMWLVVFVVIQFAIMAVGWWPSRTGADKPSSSGDA